MGIIARNLTRHENYSASVAHRNGTQNGTLNKQQLSVAEDSHISNSLISMSQSNVQEGDHRFNDVMQPEVSENSASKSISSSNSTLGDVGTTNIPSRNLLFKKARRKRLNKLRKKREIQKKKAQWSSFVLGMEGTPYKDLPHNGQECARRHINTGNIPAMSVAFNSNPGHSTDRCPISMGPEEICKLGKDLGVIIEVNEAQILERLKDMEQTDLNGKGGDNATGS